MVKNGSQGILILKNVPDVVVPRLSVQITGLRNQADVPAKIPGCHFLLEPD